MSAVNPLHAQEPRWLSDMPKVDQLSTSRTPGLKLCNAARFVCWAISLRHFPTVQDIMQRWECSRATAYRWRNALADGFGLVPPPNPPGAGRDGLPEKRLGFEAPR